MHSAARFGRLDVLELLVKYGGDVNELDNDVESINGPKGTPLENAVDAGQEEAAQWLLAHGAKDFLVDKETSILPDEK